MNKGTMSREASACLDNVMGNRPAMVTSAVSAAMSQMAGVCCETGHSQVVRAASEMAATPTEAMYSLVLASMLIK